MADMEKELMEEEIKVPEIVFRSVACVKLCEELWGSWHALVRRVCLARVKISRD